MNYKKKQMIEYVNLDRFFVEILRHHYYLCVINGKPHPDLILFFVINHPMRVEKY